MRINGRLYLTIALLCVAASLSWAQSKETTEVKYSSVIARLSPGEVREAIQKLEAVTLPCPGVNLKEVEAVYGKLKQIDPKTPPPRKWSNATHWTQLLPPCGTAEVRAFLCLDAVNGRVRMTGMNHYCVAKGRISYPEGSEMAEKRAEELQAEDRCRLADLMEILVKYEAALKKASWVKPGQIERADLRTLDTTSALK